MYIYISERTDYIDTFFAKLYIPITIDTIEASIFQI